MDSGNDMVKVENLKKQFGNITAIDIDRLSIPKGQKFGLVGNNGAGKTTLFRLVLDLIKPTHGEILVNGNPVVLKDEWKAFTGSFLDESFLIGFLSPEEYFDFIAQLQSVEKVELDTFLDRFNMFFNDEVLGKKKYIRDMSRGNQRKIGIVGSMIGSPKLLVLDEPFANLDPSSQRQLSLILREEQQFHDTTMLISSHDLTHVTEVSDRIVVLEKSKIVKDLSVGQNALADLEMYFS